MRPKKFNWNFQRGRERYRYFLELHIPLYDYFCIFVIEQIVSNNIDVQGKLSSRVASQSESCPRRGLHCW